MVRHVSERIGMMGLLVLMAACTSNPIGNDDEIKIDKTAITGQVVLADGASAERVFVWMKGFDISTWTHKDGNFRVILPADQRNATGTVQKDTLYFYLANYFIETAVVSILEGEFLFLRDDVDADGKVRGPIQLHRSITIRTDVAMISETDSVRVLVTIEVDTNCAELVNPFVISTDPFANPEIDTLGGVIIKPIGSDNLIILRSAPNARGFEKLRPCQNDPVQRELRFVPTEINLQPGEFEFIPYLLVQPDNVPQILLDKLGRELDMFDANYMNKPMRRAGGRFEWRN